MLKGFLYLTLRECEVQCSPNQVFYTLDIDLETDSVNDIICVTF